MPKKVYYVFFLVVLAMPLCSVAQEPVQSESLFSPTVSLRFHDIGYELAVSADSEKGDAEKALIFLAAAANLDSRGKYLLTDLLKVANRQDEQTLEKFAELIIKSGLLSTQRLSGLDLEDEQIQLQYPRLLYRLLSAYVDDTADLEIADRTVRRMLDRLQSREEREELLKKLIKGAGGRNDRLKSELLTLLGLLEVEKTDIDSAVRHFVEAHQSNKYNQLAFHQITELSTGQIKPSLYLEQLRLALRENPFDMETAITFAEYAWQIRLYDIASSGYEYAAKLHKYLHPSEPVPIGIYRSWSWSSYNMERNKYMCLQIAQKVRQSGRFDLAVEAFAAKSAAAISKPARAKEILTNAESKAFGLVEAAAKSTAEPSDETIRIFEQLGWFYCFAAPDANKAVDWANKAFAAKPDSPSAAGLLAYSLMMNGQLDWARKIIENEAYKDDPIGQLGLAEIQLKEGNKEQAVENLKSVISQMPGSFAAERAKGLLEQNEVEYLPLIDSDVIRQEVLDSFGSSVVPSFSKPADILSVQLNARGGKFSYGNSFDASIAIMNKSSDALLITDESFFKGNIRIDAVVSGDLQAEIPNLVSFRIKPGIAVEADQNLLIPVRFVTGRLKQLLRRHPQAGLDIAFRLYIDPVVGADGSVRSGIADIVPEKLTIRRNRVELSTRYLQNRLDTLSDGTYGQRTRIVQLFTGLLMELQLMANNEPLYDLMYAEWMPQILESAVIKRVSASDWIEKVQTLCALRGVSPDYDLTDATATALNDEQWPVRLMAIYLLADDERSNFDKVLDWTARYDTNELVRYMAVALGGEAPEKVEAEEQPEPNSVSP